MNQTNFLKIYLRKTNGSGQKVIINPNISCKLLHSLACQIFNAPQKSLTLFYKGSKISDSAQVSLQKLQVESDTIVHIQEKIQLTEQEMQLKVFCQGHLYIYKAYGNSKFLQLKAQISSMLGCNIKSITTSYLGKMTEDGQTFNENGINNNDLISVIVSPTLIHQRSSTSFKPKLAESITLATSEQVDHNSQPFPRELMRKSSMKSSHESRQSQSKIMLQVIRPKSESKVGNQDMKQSSQSFNLLKHPWLSSQRMIETESINFDDPQAEQDPENWTVCQVQMLNWDNTITLTLQCNQNHNLSSIAKLIARMEKKQLNKIQIVFGDQNSQKMAQEGLNIVEIARASGTKIIHPVIFRMKSMP